MVRSKQDTWSFSLFPFPFSFLEDGSLPAVARSFCLVTMHPKTKKILNGFVFPQQPTPLIVHKDVKDFKHGSLHTLGDIQIIFPAFETGQKETLRWNPQIVRQMQWICFELQEIKWMMHQLKEWLWCWIYFCFSFYLFLTLNWGDESALHSSISVLKKPRLLFSVFTSWMLASILFRSCLAHLIVNLLALMFFS